MGRKDAVTPARGGTQSLSAEPHTTPTPGVCANWHFPSHRSTRPGFSAPDRADGQISHYLALNIGSLVISIAIAENKALSRKKKRISACSHRVGLCMTKRDKQTPIPYGLEPTTVKVGVFRPLNLPFWFLLPQNSSNCNEIKGILIAFNNRTKLTRYISEKKIAPYFSSKI